jgi:hypothetical protein
MKGESPMPWRPCRRGSATSKSPCIKRDGNSVRSIRSKIHCEGDKYPEILSFLGEPIFEQEVEVISIGRIIDVSTGDFIYQIQFGKMFDVKGDGKAIHSPLPGAPPANKQVSIVLVLNVDIKGAAPYLVGSRWTISIDDNGKLSLTEVKE